MRAFSLSETMSKRETCLQHFSQNSWKKKPFPPLFLITQLTLNALEEIQQSTKQLTVLRGHQYIEKWVSAKPADALISWQQLQEKSIAWLASREYHEATDCSTIAAGQKVEPRLGMIIPICTLLHLSGSPVV